jgi:hypothetical protein
VDMNGPEDCGKTEGDAKGLSGFINQWIFAGMSGANGITIDCGSTGSTGSSNCVITPGPNPDCTTAGKPKSLTFQYTGGGCGASNNSQSGKFNCLGSVNTTLPITVSASNSGYTISPTTVSPGGFFTVTSSKFNAQSGFTLSNSGGTENLSIHTSCSQVLAVGNVFGDLTLVGFNGQTAGTNVNYHYTVTNNGSSTLTDVMLTDDKLGSIAGPFSLNAGQTKAFDLGVQVGQTTTNTATATAQGGSCSATSGPVTVSVPTSPTCVTCVLGYPFASSNPRTSIVFNESETLAAFSSNVSSLSNDSLKIWATDEHPMLLGISKSTVKTSGGTTTTTFPLTPKPNPPPGSSFSPQFGDPNGVDPSGRPLFPALFITDITFNPIDKSGDWQFGGSPTTPGAIFGAWKGATEVRDQTKNPPAVTITTEGDPRKKNGWNLGPGSDPVPAGTYNDGFGFEARWKLSDLRLNGEPLIVGHCYRLYFMVHDGDQNKIGGDVGHACLNVTITP